MGEEIQRQRHRFNRAYEVLNDLPFPEVTCERLQNLHYDVSEYDVATIKFVQQWGYDPPHGLTEDQELSEALSKFKAKSQAEMEGRRSLLYYKRKVDALIRDYNKLAVLLKNGAE